MKKHLAIAIVSGFVLQAQALVPRDELYQKGGDLKRAVDEGFGIVVEVKTDSAGALSRHMACIVECGLSGIEDGAYVWREPDDEIARLFIRLSKS